MLVLLGLVDEIPKFLWTVASVHAGVHVHEVGDVQ